MMQRLIIAGLICVIGVNADDDETRDVSIADDAGAGAKSVQSNTGFKVKKVKQTKSYPELWTVVRPTYERIVGIPGYIAEWWGATSKKPVLRSEKELQPKKKMIKMDVKQTYHFHEKNHENDVNQILERILPNAGGVDIRDGEDVAYQVAAEKEALGFAKKSVPVQVGIDASKIAAEREGEGEADKDTDGTGQPTATAHVVGGAGPGGDGEGEDA